MQIAGANIDLSVEREFRSFRSSSERLSLWVDAPAARAPAVAPGIDVSEAARALASRPPAGTPIEVEAEPETESGDLNLLLLVRLVETLTGRSVRMFDASEIGDAPDTPDLPTAAGTDGPARAGFGLVYEAHHVYAEAESTRFMASGTIRTADGVEIGFAIELSMARAWREESSVRIQLGDEVRQDPLVVNFGGNAAQLRDTRFAFDLTADGNQEQLPLLGPGSGFLVFDRNGDGRVNDGSELFGARTGDGFAELAALDADRNGWIDAADPAMADLRVWIPEAAGEGRLFTLAELGIGALSTTGVASPFALRGEGNSDLGMVRSTGLYLGTANTVGTLQQVDLTV